MAVLTGQGRAALSDSDFAYVEPNKTVGGKTPDKFRHFPIHDAAHVRNALARIAQGARFGAQAKGKVMAAAKKFGVQHDSSADTGRSLESLYPEVRFISNTPELRTVEDGGPQHITGYASVFGKRSRRLGGFHEQVMPTAFNEALKAIEKGDINVVCRYNHKDDMVLGTTMSGTLKVSVDERGLPYDVIPPSHRSDVMELIERRDVRYSSFAFRVPEPGTDDSWEETDHGLPMRSLHNVELVDVAPVLDPAYHDTSAVARNIAGAVESLASWVDGDPAEVRSILEAGQAARFFRRTDRPSVPALTPAASADRDENRALDDPAVSLRRWTYKDEPQSEDWTAADERVAPDSDEIRAAMKQLSHEQLCQRWVRGEPCVRPDGHDGEHAPLCWARKGGMPCHHPEGHDGDHAPMTVNTRSDEEAPEEERKEQGDASGISPVEALARLTARRKNLTPLGD